MALRNDCNTRIRFGSDSDEALVDAKTSRNRERPPKPMIDVAPWKFRCIRAIRPVESLSAWYPPPPCGSNRPLADRASIRPTQEPAGPRRLVTYVGLRVRTYVNSCLCCREFQAKPTRTWLPQRKVADCTNRRRWRTGLTWRGAPGGQHPPRRMPVRMGPIHGDETPTSGSASEAPDIGRKTFHQNAEVSPTKP